MIPHLLPSVDRLAVQELFPCFESTDFCGRNLTSFILAEFKKSIANWIKINFNVIFTFKFWSLKQHSRQDFQETFHDCLFSLFRPFKPPLFNYAEHGASFWDRLHSANILFLLILSILLSTTFWNIFIIYLLLSIHPLK